MIAECPPDFCVADTTALTCAPKPLTCSDFNGDKLALCPQDKCNLDLTLRTCSPKPPACSTYAKTLDLCPKDRCQVDFIQRTCLDRTCGSEKVYLKHLGPYTVDTTGRTQIGVVVPLGAADGAVRWDLRQVNFEYDYYPVYGVQPADGQCQISSYQLLNVDGTPYRSNMLGVANNVMFRLDTTVVGHYEFLIQASTSGAVRSEKVGVTAAVCREGSMSASTEVISRVIERYSTNVFNEANSLPNVHRIDFYRWRDLFKNACKACQPRYEIVNADKVKAAAPIWLDASNNILIKTTEGLRFKGFVKVSFPSKHCQRISGPVYIPLKFEICGQERVSVVDSASSLTQKFVMGIDSDVELLFDELRKEFKTDSEVCTIKSFQVVSEYNGVYYDLSPNLASRFSHSSTGIKLINYLGAEQDLTVYIKAFSSGKRFAYKPLKISYTNNQAPTIGGDIG